jgi:hypothetical protein
MFVHKVLQVFAFIGEQRARRSINENRRLRQQLQALCANSSGRIWLLSRCAVVDSLLAAAFRVDHVFAQI